MLFALTYTLAQKSLIPNPANSNFTIRFNTDEKENTIRLSDSAGQEVLKKYHELFLQQLLLMSSLPAAIILS